MSRGAFLSVWCVVLFALCLVLNTRHNRFPWHYHPDEPGKVEQVREGRWNFNHPMLLLSTVKTALSLSGPRNEQGIVELGRTVSAVFMSLATVALSLVAWRWRGRGAAVATGMLLATHHQLYELSHYFKEDAALLFGLSITALAAWCYVERPSFARAALLGAGCAAAISAKYLGVVAIVFAVPVLVRRPTPRVWIAFATALALGLLAVNWPMLAAPDVLQHSFAKETELVVKGQSDMTRHVPHAEYWSIFLDNTTPVMWAFLLLFVATRWRQRREMTLIETIVSVFPFAFALALSFSPKTNDRYFLPATAFFTLHAVIGASDLAMRLAPRWSKDAVLAICALVLFVAQFPSWTASRPGWLAYDRAFQRDDAQELIHWLNTEVPRDAVIAKDNRVPLPDPGRKKHADRLGIVPQRIVTPRTVGKRSDFAADIGTIEEMLAAGITHVAVSQSDYGKFFRRSLRPQDGKQTDFERRREFYARLFRECDLVFDRDYGTVIYLHPGIRVYRLR